MEAGICRMLSLSPRDLAERDRSLEVRFKGALMPSQLDMNADGSGELVTLVPADAEAADLEIGPVTEPSAPTAYVDVTSVEDYHGQATFRIRAPTCTYYYHKHGGGFASVVDADGNDWLSFRPWGGSDGIYRGIPNLAHPENVFHPGAETCISTLAASGPLRVTIRSESLCGGWACRWYIYPDRAELTVLKADHPYWLLYEGTPAGILDQNRDYCVRSDGLRRPLSDSWRAVLPSPKWIYFAKTGVPRALFLASHSREHAGCIDSYWPMEDNMTVFGFGRSDLKKFLTHTPSTFSFGLLETDDPDIAKLTIERSMSAMDAGENLVHSLISKRFT